MKKWFESTGDEGDIVISTRIRLARNIDRCPFPSRQRDKQSRDIIDNVDSAMERLGASFCDFERIDVTAKDDIYLRSLVEKHLISPEFAESSRPRALFLSKDESVSMMINEEDHVRLQVLGTGLCLKSVFDTADKLDNLLDESLHYAFDDRLGYLTNCPTNLGTGMRASVMLHLPLLTESSYMRRIINAAGKLGIAVRGLYGEGSEAQGAIYQISNCVTLGFSELEIIEQLENTVRNIIRDERKLRERVAQKPEKLADRVYRAGAILKAARILSASEAMSLMSDLRLGLGMNYDKIPESALLNRLIWEIQPANISLGKKEISTPSERDIIRAELVRRTLGSN